MKLKEKYSSDIINKVTNMEPSEARRSLSAEDVFSLKENNPQKWRKIKDLQRDVLESKDITFGFSKEDYKDITPGVNDKTLYFAYLEINLEEQVSHRSW